MRFSAVFTICCMSSFVKELTQWRTGGDIKKRAVKKRVLLVFGKVSPDLFAMEWTSGTRLWKVRMAKAFHSVEQTSEKIPTGTKVSSNKPSSGGASRGRVDATDNGVSFARPQHHRTAKSRRHEAALQRKEAALRRALELQRELRRIEAEQVRLEEQLSRARAHQLEAEVSAQALGAEGNRYKIHQSYSFIIFI